MAQLTSAYAREIGLLRQRKNTSRQYSLALSETIDADRHIAKKAAVEKQSPVSL